MTKEQIIKLFEETAYVRTGGSDAERKCAEQPLWLRAPVWPPEQAW